MRTIVCVALAVCIPWAAGAQIVSTSASAAAQSSAVHEWTLEEVLAAVAADHPQVQASQARVDAAVATRRTAGVWSNPVFTHWIENASPSLFSSPAGLDREASTYATVPLEPLFQRASRERRADRELAAAKADVIQVQRRLALEAARAFFRVALGQIVVATASENQQALESVAAYNRARVSQGATAEIELMRVQIEIDRAALDGAVAEAELARARAELRVWLTSRTPAESSQLRVSTTVGVRPDSPLPPLASLIADARGRRPELLAARARVEASAAETEYQRRLLFRQLGASVGVKQSAGRNSLIAGISLPIPLFDRNTGEIQRTTAERLAAERELDAAGLAVEMELASAYEGARRLSTAFSGSSRGFLDRAADLRRLTLAAYQEGGATLLQVLDATRTLSDARLSYYRAAFAARQGLIELAVAGGDDPLQNRTK